MRPLLGSQASETKRVSDTVKRVMLVDDHAIVRAGLRALIEGMTWLSVVGEAADGREALSQAEALQPDVILMDITMPVMNGLEVAERLRKSYPSMKVIFLSMHTNAEFVLRALRVGAAGYVIKDAAVPELELAIRSALKGERFLSPRVSSSVIDRFLTPQSGASTPLERLTPRQREILQLIAEGKSNKTIARELDLTVKTIESHRAQMMDRLEIHDAAGLVRFAIRAGLAPE